MKTAFFSISIFAALINISCSNLNDSNLKVSNQAILIHNANIINVKDGRILENQAILIDSSIIQ